MIKLISFLAVAALGYFIYFVIKRLLRFIVGRKQSTEALHEQLADVAEDIASASKVAAALSSLAAFAVAPAGLLAVGAAMGLVPTPFIVDLLPPLLVFAGATYALSAAAKLYAKSRRKRN